MNAFMKDVDASESDNTKSELIQPPSYLWDFLVNKESQNLILVYLEKPVQEHFKAPRSNEYSQVSLIDNTLDVTGSPLEVDLGGEDTLIIEKIDVIQHWSEDENRHSPMSISKARRYINSKTDSKASEDGKAIFVVCDGDNPLKTVLLGVQASTKKLFTCTVNIVGVFSKNNPELTIQAMESSHYVLTGKRGCKVNYVVTFKYFIFGTFLHNIKEIDESEYSGSVCVETSSTSRCSLEKPSNLDQMKIILQVIAGHEKSLVHCLWEELCLLKNYIHLMEKVKSNCDTGICKNYLLEEEIYDRLREIVTNNLMNREPKIEFDLHNIRQQSVMSRLWIVLKHCRDLGVLRNAFHYFFEELAQSNYYNKVLEVDCNVATIINGIIDGKLAVPTISYIQALEFLFEIGCETTKNDYQAIGKHFHSYTSKDISNKWAQLQSISTVEANTRSTRFTQYVKDYKVDIKRCKAKLNYLGKLHVTSELIYLVQSKAFLPEEAFYYLCKKVYENYLAKDSTVLEFNDLLDSPVRELHLFINIADSDIIKNRAPDFCSVRMTSTVGNTQSETVYVSSKYTIIPPTIYNDYDISSIDKEEIPYYVYKLESHSEAMDI